MEQDEIKALAEKAAMKAKETETKLQSLGSLPQMIEKLESLKTELKRREVLIDQEENSNIRATMERDRDHVRDSINKLQKEVDDLQDFSKKVESDIEKSKKAEGQLKLL